MPPNKLIHYLLIALISTFQSEYIFASSLLEGQNSPDFMPGQYEIRKSAKERKIKATTKVSSSQLKTPAALEFEKKQARPVKVDQESRTIASEHKVSLLKGPDANPPLQTNQPGQDSDFVDIPLSHQLKSLVAKDDTQSLAPYYSKLEEEDVRNNRMEIDWHALYSQIDSSSNYSYRKYRLQYPGFDIGANIWITPGIGITSRISYSVGASIPNSSPSLSHSLAKFEDIDFGIKLRKFLGISRLADYFETGIILTDYNVNVLADDSQRLRTSTSGLALWFTVYLPKTVHTTQHFSFQFAPRLSHSETSTGVDAFSGSPADSTKVGLLWGTDLKFGRQHQLLFDLGYFIEKNQFTGPSSIPDRDSGQTLTNVAVQTSTTMLRVGYRWGQ